MKLSESIKIDNPVILDLLSKISTYIINNKDLISMADEYQIRDSDTDCVSEKYLYEHCFNNVKQIDFAEYENAINLSKLDNKEITRLIDNLKHYIGVNDLSIAALYPKKSKLSWHHNGNAAGEAVLFSYSIDGNGFFRYYDKSTESIVDVPDSPGWFCKLVSYNDPNLYGVPAWHCASTENYRISVGFKIPIGYRKKLACVISNEES
jgi:hypothetical protein